jgi:hypothetical protein
MPRDMTMQQLALATLLSEAYPDSRIIKKKGNYKVPSSRASKATGGHGGNIPTSWVGEVGVCDDTWIEDPGAGANDKEIMTVDVNLISI